MTAPAHVALLVTAWVLGAGLSATATTAAVAAVASPPSSTSIATTSPLPVVGTTATAGCAADAVAVRDATAYSTLAPQAEVGVAGHEIRGQHAGGWTSRPARRDAIASRVATCLTDEVDERTTAGGTTYIRRGPATR